MALVSLSPFNSNHQLLSKMRNGQGSPSEIASSSRLYDPVNHHNNEIDGGDNDDICCSSQYSSCGESDFDKYCSANSAMGTPSVCGSVRTVFHDFNNDSDFGSLKSFKLSDEGSNSSCFRVNRRLSNYRGSEFCDGEMSNHMGLGEGLSNIESSSRHEENICVGEELKEENIINVGNNGVEQESGGLEVLSDLDYEGDEFEKCSNEGENSSRYDHSEGEDSMFGNGTDDDDRRINVYHRTSIQPLEESNKNHLFMTSVTAFGSNDFDDYLQETGNNPLSCELLEAGNSSILMAHNGKKEADTDYLPPNTLPSIKLTPKEAHPLDKSDEANQLKDNDAKIDDLAFSRSNLSKSEHDPLLENPPLKGDSEHIRSEEDTLMEFKERKELLRDPFSDFAVNHQPSMISSEAKSVKDDDSNEVNLIQASPIVYNRFEDYFTPGKTNTNQQNEFFDEFVHDMEEVLLDTNESPGSRLTQNNPLKAHIPSRDGGSTASTSRSIDTYPLIQNRVRINSVEVIGAKQKKGDVSFSERLVGVKEYTVYVIKVWTIDTHWEIERRYRDFFTLYRDLKRAFTEQGWTLPSPWSLVEQESRKMFGTSSPSVVSERSQLIQQCLTSVLPASSTTLINFLSPSKAILMKKNSIDSSLGSTISFVVKIQPQKSVKQLLDAQHYTCGGCRKSFNDGKTRLQDLVQTFGWGKPRLCEYSGQLFCSMCHTNDYAVLPARVLHYWDFSKYPVSQLAKSYLDSIYDQPMICVGAVNPQLFLKVTTLQHVTNVRKRIRDMLIYVRCPFRTSINKALGSRRYLIESTDFFALRDLVDLSKGVFAGLPLMMESVSKRILQHITEQCLVCCDVGIPCNARQVCDDPSSFIFPFQEGEIEKCKACSLAFHKNCFKKVVSCPCGVHLKAEEGSLGLVNMESSAKRLFSGLLSKVTRKLGEEVQPSPTDNNNNIILMGSLPNTSL